MPSVGLGTAFAFKLWGCKKIYSDEWNPLGEDRRRECEGMADTIINLAGNVFSNAAT